MHSTCWVKVIALLAISSNTVSAILARPGFKRSSVSEAQPVLSFHNSTSRLDVKDVSTQRLNDSTARLNVSTARLNASFDPPYRSAIPWEQHQSCAYAVPAKGSCSKKTRWYVLDLDMPPRKRWAHIVTPYRKEIVEAVRAHRKFFLEVMYGEEYTMNLMFKYQLFHKDYLEEMQGIVDVLGSKEVTLDDLKLFNMAYETSQPARGATESTVVIAKNKLGKVFHGRDDGAQQNTLFEKISVGVTLQRQGKLLADMAVVLGQVGTDAGRQRRASTGWRPWKKDPSGGWTVSRNGRLETGMQRPQDHKRWIIDCTSAAGMMGQIGSHALRQHLEIEPATFIEAYHSLSRILVTAPQFFILSGVDDAVVMGHQRPHRPNRRVPNERWLSTHPESWYMVQTSTDGGDHPQHEKCSFDRRAKAEQALQSLGQDDLTTDKLFGVLHGEGVRTKQTLFSWITSESIPDKDQPLLENWFDNCALSESNSAEKDSTTKKERVEDSNTKSGEKKDVEGSSTKKESAEDSSTKKERVEESSAKKDHVEKSSTKKESKKDEKGYNNPLGKIVEWIW